VSNSGVATSSYWNTGFTLQSTSDGGNGLTTVEMKGSSNFTDWNFTSIWSISEGGSFPYLTMYTTSPLPGSLVFASGAGTSSDPYIIKIADQLTTMRDSLSSHFRLGEDIDLSHISDWSPIGSSSNPFEGSLDGGGYKITGLTINSTASSRGLFGEIFNADIDSVWLEDVNISGGDRTGALVGNIPSVGGTAETSNITNSYATGTVSSVGDFTGGLIGFMSEYNSVSNSYTDVTVVSTGNEAGGFIGEALRSTIEYCYALGNVTGTSTSTDIQVGGFIGYNGERNVINYSFATGNVTSSGGSFDSNSSTAGGTGGFAGVSGLSTRASTITNSFALGMVTYDGSEADPNVGAFIGTLSDGNIQNNYAAGKVNASGSDAHGFIGSETGSTITLTSNYWDTTSTCLLYTSPSPRD